MKKLLTLLLIFGFAILFLAPTVSAVLREWHNTPPVGNDIGETFELRFEIESDETTNYSITIYPETKFSVINDQESITIQIPTDETRTFIFNIVVEEELEDGKHAIYYNASKAGVVFKSDVVHVRAGKQVPGFEIIILVSAIALVGFIRRKKR